MRLRGVKSSQIYLEMKDDLMLTGLLEEEEQSSLDVTKIPEISRDEFRKAVKKKGFAINQKNVDKIFSELDYDRNNTVCYKNFR
jgi:Ca2+-binding EF-hand superfamily protein